ncbi:MAG: glyoxylate carboligase, partial [Actinomycetales bacterium]|nr:glyoxylate carboligase [Actinomycetales bacterium]
MTRMRTVDAIALILEKEGATEAFGLPGAAINPFYSAMKAHGGIRHTLHRHVEGASHAADGYSRATGGIGICVGTSGPAGTDMITGLYAAQADSIPILAITGQAPTSVLHKEDFQAIDIESIAKPVTKYASTILEPGLVPGTFAKAFQIMRSARPGPVLLDLPLDVQLAEIEFDIDMYEPLPVDRPAATRAQAEKVLDMLVSAERPLLIAGGGVINANASEQLVELAELLDIPVSPTLMGWGAIADDHRLQAGMIGIQTHTRYGNETFLRSDVVVGIGNRWANRHTGALDTYREGRRFVHIDIESTQIGRIFTPDLGIVSDAGAALEQLLAAARDRRAAGTLPDWSQWSAECTDRKGTGHRKTN